MEPSRKSHAIELSLFANCNRVEPPNRLFLAGCDRPNKIFPG